MNLAEIRHKNGLSQARLAEMVGLSRITIARYELGISMPPPSFRFQLSTIFHIPLEDIELKMKK